jgi:hypothetical protein
MASKRRSWRIESHGFDGFIGFDSRVEGLSSWLVGFRVLGTTGFDPSVASAGNRVVSVPWVPSHQLTDPLDPLPPDLSVSLYLTLSVSLSLSVSRSLSHSLCRSGRRRMKEEDKEERRTGKKKEEIRKEEECGECG